MTDGSPIAISDFARELIQGRNFGYLATVMEDGSPQVSPIWVDVRDDLLLINTAADRLKERNLRRDPRTAISIADKDNQYRKVDIRGRVVEWVDGEDAENHIDALAKKYVDEDHYPWRAPGERRVLAIVEVLRMAESV
jgi:PPOX class probable F420-dependent enzyme